MKDLIHYGRTLGIICLLATGLLAGVNMLTKPQIAAQMQKELQESLKEVLPQAARFELSHSEQGNFDYYRGVSGDNKLVGVAFTATAKGYSSVIETLVGMQKDGSIHAIKVLSQNETPGLGSRITETKFGSQFNGKQYPQLDQVQAITGATISSRAVIESVKQRAVNIKESIFNE